MKIRFTGSATPPSGRPTGPPPSASLVGRPTAMFGAPVEPHVPPPVETVGKKKDPPKGAPSHRVPAAVLFRERSRLHAAIQSLITSTRKRGGEWMEIASKAEHVTVLAGQAGFIQGYLRRRPEGDSGRSKTCHKLRCDRINATWRTIRAILVSELSHSQVGDLLDGVRRVLQRGDTFSLLMKRLRELQSEKTSGS